MIHKLMQLLQEGHPLRACDPGEFSSLRANGMRFTVWAWEAECPPLTDMAAKQAKTAAYVEGLLTHGGPSTDVFKKALGPEKTEQLFRKVLFGTE